VENVATLRPIRAIRSAIPLGFFQQPLQPIGNAGRMKVRDPIETPSTGSRERRLVSVLTRGFMLGLDPGEIGRNDAHTGDCASAGSVQGDRGGSA
jgi:hypothetical protein